MDMRPSLLSRPAGVAAVATLPLRRRIERQRRAGVWWRDCCARLFGCSAGGGEEEPPLAATAIPPLLWPLC